MLNEKESKYFEKWTDTQRNQQFHRRVIMGMMGLVGILALIAITAGDPNPLVVERANSVFRPMEIESREIKPTKEAVGEMLSEFIMARYEWNTFDPQTIIKNLEPFTTEDFRDRLFQEFGKKNFQNKPGESIEQSVARVKPDVSEKSILASFDRVLRINSVPVVVPTQISVQLSEGPKTFFNPIGLYINGVIEHEGQ
jgi:hypothetical protein